MLIDAKELLIKKKRDRKAVGAFNVSSIEALQAVFRACSQGKSEVFITTSAGESRHLMPEIVFSICQKLSIIYKVDFCLHLDHGNDISWIGRCLEAGYNSIHADFGELDYKDNLRKTKEIRKLTDRYGAQLEGELGVIPLKYYREKIEDNLELTNPKLASKYVEDTGVDSLAVSIGTESGMYKSSKKIYIEILKKINKDLSDTPLVLHGGSLLSKKQYQDCIKNGIAKININTELRLAYTRVLKRNLTINPNEYTPYRLLKGCREAMEKVILRKLKVF